MTLNAVKFGMASAITAAILWLVVGDVNALYDVIYDQGNGAYATE